jgi:metal-responsive CopG/Arc/MetJ family transcriptional regulator
MAFSMFSGQSSHTMLKCFDNACQYFTMTAMRTARTISITLPPELLAKAQELAEREHRTMSELFREALRCYMQTDTEWKTLLMRTRAAGQAMGITSEAEVERLSDEYRHGKR